ncbi:MAG: bifunctional adenosylcobinamide kinase/adenosylcobinamide-phosphate guanylyltransferase [Lachnospiraceae bacterium]|nr:bifunctional adenosylcobinamide kinase/adenosylcobinamide-phosphate guanylyltransferase [Lachnospiraceae bacterium]
MHLVIGGAYQGKKEYVKKKYSIEESDIWQGGYPVAGGQWRCINGLHKIIEQMLYQYEANCICEVKEDEKVPIGSAANSVQQKESYVNKTLEYLSTMIERNPDLIFICDEVGNGIVPVEKEERDYRECVGRVLCVLAEKAERVERVHCGISQKIKDTVYITLIRHGSTAGNLQKRYIGTTDEALSPAGREFLENRKSAGNYPKAARVITSPMQRCLETAEILYPDVIPEVYPEFRETDFGAFEGKTYEELMEDNSLQSVYQKWLDSGGTMAFPEGESMEQMKQRCVAGFERLLATLQSDAVIIAHGGTIMSLLQMYATPWRDYYDYQCANGAGYLCRLELTGDNRLLRMEIEKEIL